MSDNKSAYCVRAFRGKNHETNLGRTFVLASSVESAKSVGREAMRFVFGLRGKFVVTATEYHPERDMEIRQYLRAIP